VQQAGGIIARLGRCQLADTVLILPRHARNIVCDAIRISWSSPYF
jgi:hypothetical protein